ncbi:MAG: NAD-glutamate dehydrogenase [Cucumibacter sp.]
MTIEDAPARGRLLRRTAELGARDADFGRFLTQLVEAIEETDFAGGDPEALISIFRQSFAGLAAHTPGRHTINIWTPGPDAPPGTRIVDIYNDDMPFLVDSTLLAIRALGGTVMLLGHPILKLKRGGGKIEVLASGEGTEKVSHLHIHVAGIGDEVEVAALRDELDEVLVRVRRVVRGWRPMLERLGEVVRAYRDGTPRVDPEALAEAMHFLAWLADRNFTFLGMREYAIAEKGAIATLEPISETGLGILEDATFRYIRQGTQYMDMTPQHMAYLRTPDPLLVTKANAQAKVHRRTHMDYVGIKLYGKDGMQSGELRVIGLFTSASLAIPLSDVPLVRRKVAEVMGRSGLDPKSHSGKALMNALDNYSRDELFQIGVDDLLDFASLIAALSDRPRIRVLPRIDPFDNFVSVLVYLPRDRYDSDLRARIGLYLATRYEGRVSAFYPSFPEGELVRVHFIIGRNGGATPRPGRAELEAHVIDLTRSFGDRLLARAPDPASVAAYADAFTRAYQEAFTYEQALDDIARFEALADDGDIALHLGRHARRDNALSLKIYHLKSPIPLSARVPMLENFGFKVINERSYLVAPRDGPERLLHDMTLQPDHASAAELLGMAAEIEAAILAVWHRRAENDGFNQLTLAAGMKWDDAALIRAYGRYLRQIGIAWSQHYLWTTLASSPDVARALVSLFYTRLDPTFEGDRVATEEAARETIATALEEITSIDDDRIVRRFLNLVDATVRTNFFQRPGGIRRPALALKFNAALIEALPEPRSWREIWVCSPRLEGVHLRGAPIARGGIRWSDRPEDFRTEVLGLVKAQIVKNAVIVPTGAKGGFFPKQTPPGANREQVLAEGLESYKIFIGALLDLTDNFSGDRVVPPEGVRRLDGDDPYLVVAADKGTATFSDTANALADARSFWLADAFASGGSAGYDHKKMGITARGAWEAVKRHFREIDRDIQTSPVTVAGVGDMSGDVFGNGMLLSGQIRLVAAFDHRDIFIDPDPDPVASFAERKRLFEMGRSSWQDYDRKALSAGGGIYSRGAKTLDLSKAAHALLGLPDGKLTPAEVMNSILRAEVDLLWFGGIGTYAAASHERDAEVGDRANDAIRVRAPDLRARVIGEGANLAVTQLGRIEYARRGGRINTDAIDNSAGVNSSDLEVNIKIALGPLVSAGTLKIADRNTLLAGMTGEVAALCLRNNYLQSLAVSLAERQGARDIPFYASMIGEMEAAGELSRAIEFLPDDSALAAREAAGEGLVRPELAVLLAYAKNTLSARLLASSVPDDPHLGAELVAYFPPTLVRAYPDAVATHRLRREVIATVLCNAMVNRGGPLFVHQLASATGANAAEIAAAFAIANSSYGLEELDAAIAALDNKVKGATQLALYAEVRTLLHAQTNWFLRHAKFSRGISEIAIQYREGVAIVRAGLNSTLPEFIASSIAEHAATFVAGGAPPELARRIAELSALTLASDVVAVAARKGIGVADAAHVYFAILGIFGLGRITELGGAVAVADYYDRMALDRAITNMLRAQRELTLDVVGDGGRPVAAALEAWREARGEEIERTRRRIASITEGPLTVSRLSVAAGLLSDLARGFDHG